jgi:hypothetical protein
VKSILWRLCTIRGASVENGGRAFGREMGELNNLKESC